MVSPFLFALKFIKIKIKILHGPAFNVFNTLYAFNVLNMLYAFNVFNSSKTTGRAASYSSHTLLCIILFTYYSYIFVVVLQPLCATPAGAPSLATIARLLTLTYL